MLIEIELPRVRTIQIFTVSILLPALILRAVPNSFGHLKSVDSFVETLCVGAEAFFEGLNLVEGHVYRVLATNLLLLNSAQT